MKINTHDLTRKDWELCRTYVQEIKQKGFPSTKRRSLNSRSGRQTQIENPGSRPLQSCGFALRTPGN